MEPKPIYFDRESPDFNMGLYGKPERLAANRVVMCLITEFGLCNNKRMQTHQVNVLIESLQATTGRFEDPKIKVKLKSSYIKKKHVTKPIKTIGPAALSEHTSRYSLIESTS